MHRYLEGRGSLPIFMCGNRIQSEERCLKEKRDIVYFGLYVLLIVGFYGRYILGKQANGIVLG